VITLFAWGFIYAGAAACGIVISDLICARIERHADGPAPVRLHPAVPIVLFALLGIVVAARGANLIQLSTIATLGVPLIGAWYSDARTGIVPDLFTLVPLAIVAVIVLLHHTWWVAISAGVIFGAFALAATFSRGRGMGWGDAKLAMLSGAALGLQVSLLTLAVACFAATIVSVVRNRGTQPIAFAPYIVVAMLFAFGLSVHG
jgi:prepilin signal peptidase PulO-like enzyme (type II secretory pathway)